ncbi:MAG: radical SAM protein [Bacteroidetes bacterium]|nr:radical SAM protein [Bacteroidota bacterium]MBS1629711.1 radical SAM protein [Bacteroidota bacterium]
MEHFYTLQGEGMYSGQAAYFIRLGGCDVGCVWCDVKESWDAAAHPQLSVAALVQAAAAQPARIVVITGGEPALYDLTALIAALRSAGFRTHIETSGSSPLVGSPDFITLSPKKFKAPLPEVLGQADELKVVVFHKSDFDWAEQHALHVREDCCLLLQPEWSKRVQMTPMVVEYIQAHPQWRLSLQSHKYIGVP